MNLQAAQTQFINARRMARPANTMVVFGDSQTTLCGVASGSGDINVENRSWFMWINAFTGGAFDLVYNAGVGGERTDQMLARIGTDVLAYRPGWCFVMGGVNDISQGYTAAVTMANLTTIVRTLTAAGIRVILSTTTPSSYYTTTAMQDEWYKLNTLIKRFGITEPNVHLVDMGGAVASPDTYTYGNALWTLSGVHFAAQGSWRAAKQAVSDLSGFLPVGHRFPMGSLDPNEMFPNPMMTGTSGSLTTLTGSAADGLTFAVYGTGAAGTASKVARTDYVPGEWQQVTMSGGDHVEMTTGQITLPAGVAPGDKIRGAIEIDTGGDWTAVHGSMFYIQARDASSTVLNTVTVGQAPGSYPDLTIDPGPHVLVTPEWTLPANTAKVRMYYDAWISSGTIRVGRATVQKV